jgi:glycerophosphoryl diester phosphodiesterase
MDRIRHPSFPCGRGLRIAGLLASLAAAAPASAQPAVEIIGHRGAAGLAPENTLAAFSRACAIGVDGIELDVHLSADGVLVVHHDYALNPDIARDASGAWVADSARPLLRDLTLEALRRYDVGRLRPDADYAQRHPEQVPADGERIPTLDEVITHFLAECAPPTRLVVEIKTDPTRPHLSADPDTLTDRTVALLRARGVTDRTQVIAFDWRPLRRVHAIAPDLPTSFLTVESRDFDTIEHGVDGASPWLDGLDVDAHGGSVPRAIVAAGGRNWSPNFRNVTPEVIAEAHALGLRVYPWTVNAEDDLHALLALGVDGITTDRPDRLRGALRAKAGAASSSP